MSLFDKEARRVWLGVGLGVGAVTLYPFVAPVLAAIARPLTKVLLAQSLVAFERVRERGAHLGEAISDVIAEVRAEAEEALAARRVQARAAADTFPSTESAGRATPSREMH